MDFVVSGGSDPERPIRAPQDHQQGLLRLIAVGVFLVAAGTAFTGWTVYQQAEDNRTLNCAYLTVAGSDDDSQNYDDMPTYQQKIVDRLDCDVPGR
jgi:hypothetical protein